MSCEIWITSDLHLGKDNGGFSGVDEEIIENLNELVQLNDILYIIGDLKYGNRDAIARARRAIKCKNVHLITGNHDSETEKNVLIRNKPARSYFSSVSTLLHKRIRGVNYVMCHYPLQRWKGDSNGSVMLHGHMHGKNKEYKNKAGLLYKQIDVGIMTNNWKPYNLKDIQNLAESENYCNFVND